MNQWPLMQHVSWSELAGEECAPWWRTLHCSFCASGALITPPRAAGTRTSQGMVRKAGPVNIGPPPSKSVKVPPRAMWPVAHAEQSQKQQCANKSDTPARCSRLCRPAVSYTTSGSNATAAAAAAAKQPEGASDGVGGCW
jgi:hypothetical protein